MDLHTLGPQRWATLVAVAVAMTGCPASVPDSSRFSGQAAADVADAGALAGDAGLDAGALAGDAGVDAPSDAIPQSDGGETKQEGDAKVADGDGKSGGLDSGCDCNGEGDCAGIAVGTCQVAVCKACTCVVTAAAEGASCGGAQTCQKGKCSAPPKPGPWAIAIAAGGRHSCAVHPDGTASCWGNSSQGQVGGGTTSDKVLQPKAVASLSAVAMLVAGNSHTCAVHGGGKVSCWGDRFGGQTGNGDNNGYAVVPEAAGTITDALRVAAGTYTSLAVRKGLTLWGWGNNNGGQMLNGTLQSQKSPVQVAPVLDVKRVCAGDHHACAMHSDGAVECWGRNTDGQVGHGTAVYDSPPLPAGVVTGLPAVTDIACGDNHTCAWNATGKAWCWGKNSSGQLSTGDYSSQPVGSPVTVGGLSDVAMLAAGQGHTCAVRKTGQVACWGNNDKGQAGASGSGSVYVPQQIDIGGMATAVTTGTDHACALREDGAVLCWGNNSNGQLGNGGTGMSATPVVVTGSAK